ncbi:MAG: outer membrane lipoprotein-sorting protein, partial [Verrucomicrobia bacterium]|nr:outer membrane lipoprotein-sorting protein [Verrucomicrobiota bacterium]
ASLSPASRTGRVPHSSSGSPGRTRPTEFRVREEGSLAQEASHEPFDVQRSMFDASEKCLGTCRAPHGRASLSPASRVGRVQSSSSGSPGRTRPTEFRVRAAFLGLLLLIAAPPSVLLAAEPSDTEAAALVSELLSQRPPEDLTLTGRLRVSNSKGTLSRLQVKYTVKLHPDRWEGTYEAGPAGAPPAERLTVVHFHDSPNQYLHWRAAKPTQPAAEPARLSGAQAAIPFAGSDFWLSDLGLEFLHWPKQRLARDKIRMRNHRLCHVLESTNPNPADKDYAQVVSWIDREFGGLIYAVAYDAAGRKVKVFELRSFTKNQATGMQMWNEKTDTKTYLELQPGPK